VSDTQESPVKSKKNKRKRSSRRGKAMGKNKDVPFHVRYAITELLKNGIKQSEIVQQFSVNKSVVSRLNSKLKAGQILKENPKKGKTGRKEITSEREDRTILKTVLENRSKTSAMIIEILSSIGINISERTFRRRMKNFGVKCCKKTNKFLLIERMMQARLNWAKKYEHFTVEDWRKVCI
jgi:transposase